MFRLTSRYAYLFYRSWLFTSRSLTLFVTLPWLLICAIKAMDSKEGSVSITRPKANSILLMGLLFAIVINVNAQQSGRAAVDKALDEASILFEQGKPESLRAAFTKFDEAQELAHSVGYIGAQAISYVFMGRIKHMFGDKQTAINYYARALPLLKADGNESGEAKTFTNLGNVYLDLGKYQQAIDYYTQALPLYSTIGDRSDAATTLKYMGLAYTYLDENQKAIDCFNQAVPLLRADGNKSEEALILAGIGKLYGDLGYAQKALDYYNQAVPLLKADGYKKNEALILDRIGGAYSDLGDQQQALDFHNQALLLWKAIGDKEGEATSLMGIGSIYSAIGENQKAIDYSNQALSLFRITGEKHNEATTLNNIGKVYFQLGEYQEAVDSYDQALSIYKSIGDRSSEATILNNIGSVYSATGENQKAIDYYNQSLPLLRAGGYKLSEARNLTNIGLAHSRLGENQKAIDYYNQSLPLLKEVGDKNGEAVTLNNIGLAYSAIGENQKAIGYYNRSLPLLNEVEDKRSEAGVLSNMMHAWTYLNNPRYAVFYGKQCVNAYQQLRGNIHGLDKEFQKSFLRSVENDYRFLVNLLIVQGRYAEALQVLNAFKDQQYFDLNRETQKKPTPLALTQREADSSSRYIISSNEVGNIDKQVEELKRTLGTRAPTPGEYAQLQQLESNLNTVTNAYLSALEQASTEFGQPIDPLKDKTPDIADVREMQTALRELITQTGKKTIAVYTLVANDNFRALIVTPDDLITISTPIKGDTLNNKATQLWGLLRSDEYDPKLLSKEIYDFIFKPIQDNLLEDKKLEQVLPEGATIMWSLDGNLRYLPMSALYDGEKYLAERYNHVVFTRADKERLTRAASPTWRGYGFAVSEPHRVEFLGSSIEFSRLEFGEEEMQIFRTKSHPNGIIDGEVFPEVLFTKAALLTNLKQRRPLVHISSHFRFSPGDESRSFLLLGDGKIMTLAEIKEQENLFQGVELLTLSACDTAAQHPDATGREIDAFAELAQRLGAGSVLASLWAVRDRSTAQLIKGFYGYRQGGTYTKAEALRKAQLNLLYGNTQGLAAPTKQASKTSHRGASEFEEIIVDAKYRVPFKVDKLKPFAHPYYWSPFVLFGNWK